MNLRKTASTLVLSLIATLPLSALAGSVGISEVILENIDSDILFKNPRKNKNIDDGTYDFLGLHARKDSTFADQWKFSLAETSDVVINLVDTELSMPGSANAENEGFSNLGSSYQAKKNPSPKFLLDNKFLTISLFDAQENLLGSTGTNGSISALSLASGQWYTIMVSGKVNGVFGSIYNGSLSVSNPSPVPLGAALPLFASGLLGLLVTRKKQLAS